MLREALLHGKDWPAIAKQQKKTQFGAASKQLAQERLHSLLESFEMMCQVEQQHSKQDKGSKTGSALGLLDGGAADEAAVLAATVKVICSRQVGAATCLNRYPHTGAGAPPVWHRCC